MSKIVVVGANHAGTACLNTILDNYKGHEVVAFDANSNISFLGCGMALWIGNQIHTGDGLFYSNKDTLESKGATIHMETPIDRVDYSNKIVHATNKAGEKIEESYDKLIFATGSLPISPNIPGKELENVQFVKLYQNAQEVIEKLKDPKIKNVVVVGAGYIGVELAEAFVRNGRNCTLVDIAPTCLANYYDPEFSDLMEKNLVKNGVNAAFGQSVERIEGENGKCTKVVTDKGTYDADMVILGVGFRPNTALGNGEIELFRNGAFLVNKEQETSMKDVYAIGDCATVYDNSIQDTNYIALATNAVRSGIIAGHNACGTHLQSEGVQGSNGISIFDLNMVSTGLSYTKAIKLGYDAKQANFEDLQKPEFIETGNNDVKIRIVYDAKTRVVLGAQIASDYDISMAIHMFSLAIQEQVTIDKLKLLDIFFLPHFNKPYNYITMCALQAE